MNRKIFELVETFQIYNTTIFQYKSCRAAKALCLSHQSRLLAVNFLKPKITSKHNDLPLLQKHRVRDPKHLVVDQRGCDVIYISWQIRGLWCDLRLGWSQTYVADYELLDKGIVEVSLHFPVSSFMEFSMILSIETKAYGSRLNAPDFSTSYRLHENGAM
ncbi:hypothetical protein BC833DRAFT_640622 [Globomyces pollinis-pini]|nr:hypothetical protein BC833DRAFT_640622 [Globomyces pollinis-pini]